MELKIHSIAGQGDPDGERLVIDVQHDCNLITFVLFNNTCGSNGKPTNEVRHSYWLPDQRVKRGDVVVLYTRLGEPSLTQNSDGSATYFLFMGMDRPIWDGPGGCAVLARLDKLESMPVV